MILKLFSNKRLWKEIIRRETGSLTDEVEAYTVWKSVYSKTPELVEFFKRREVNLLKAATLKDKSNDFILGQIAENRLFLRFDTGEIAEQKVANLEKVKLPDKDKFLKRWKDGKDVSKGGLPRGEAQPA